MSKDKLYVAVYTNSDFSEKGVDRYPSSVVGVYTKESDAYRELLRVLFEMENLEVFTDYEELTSAQNKARNELINVLDDNKPVYNAKYNYFIKHGTKMQESDSERYWDAYVQVIMPGKNMYTSTFKSSLE